MSIFTKGAAASLVFKTNPNEFYRGQNLSATPFTGTILGAPIGATLVYNPTGGNESDLAQYDGLGVQTANNLTAMILRNTTIGEELPILDVNLATNTITFMSNVPGTWLNGHAITTDSGLGANMRVIKIKDETVIPASVTQILLFAQLINSAAGGVQLWTQKFATFTAAETWVLAHTAGAGLGLTSFITIPLIDRKLIYNTRPALTNTIALMRLIGYQS